MDNEFIDMMKDDLQKKMDNAINNLKKEFGSVRTGRATPAILDPVRVDYYGIPTPISQVANISVPEPQLLVINPWEKKMLKEVERSIVKANLGLSVSNDGNIIRANVPPLTEERRKELVKQIKKMAEEFKVEIRNFRREANDNSKKMEKDKEISQDQNKIAHETIQQLTDSHIKIIDELAIKKEKELLTV